VSETTSERRLRYDRQQAYVDLGAEGQERLSAARALIVGVGGLGSWLCELLARAGVGMLRLVDSDRVDWTNVHRQAMYDESDAEANRPKARAAARRLKRINSEITVEPLVAKMGADNIEELAGDADVILDGTDNFATRFLLNDYAVKANKPWVFAGVVRAEGQTMTVVPHRTACLRCIYEGPPPEGMELRAANVGVLGPAVAALASIEALEAMKILSGRLDAVSPYLLKLELWNNEVYRIDAAKASANLQCPCCVQGRFEYLSA